MKGTVHTDNEDGLQYRVTNIREHMTRHGFQIVVNRVCLVGGYTDTVYARDAAAMTGPSVEPRDQSAAASLGLAATGERTLVESTLARDRLFETACESGDVATVNRLLAEGVNPNFEVNSRIQPGKIPTDSPQVRVKRQLWIREKIRVGDLQD